MLIEATLTKFSSIVLHCFDLANLKFILNILIILNATLRSQIIIRRVNIWFYGNYLIFKALIVQVSNHSFSSGKPKLDEFGRDISLINKAKDDKKDDRKRSDRDRDRKRDDRDHKDRDRDHKDRDHRDKDRKGGDRDNKDRDNKDRDDRKRKRSRSTSAEPDRKRRR